jgi:MHS family proline/betaine transporter-like MFS transporter
MIAINLVMLVSIAPTFLILTRNPTATIIIIAVFWLAALKAMYFGPLAALMSELLPAASRATGLGLGYNIGVTVFGGMGPVFMTWLGGIALIGDLAPAWYLTVVGFISLAALVTIRTTNAASHGA